MSLPHVLVGDATFAIVKLHLSHQNDYPQPLTCLCSFTVQRRTSSFLKRGMCTEHYFYAGCHNLCFHTILTFQALIGNIQDWTEYLISASIPKTVVKHLGIFMSRNAGWTLPDQPRNHLMCLCALLLGRCSEKSL